MKKKSVIGVDYRLISLMFRLPWVFVSVLELVNGG